MSKGTGSAGDATWIPTFSGQLFDVFAPRPESLRFGDMAHSLAMRCRWGGHCREFHSVAHHAVLVSRLVPAELALWGLLHDCGEYVLPDVQRPIKPELGRFIELEDSVLRMIVEAYGLAWPMPAAVKFADDVVTAWEWRDLLTDAAKAHWRPERADSIPVGLLQPVTWQTAKRLWLARYAELVPGPRKPAAAAGRSSPPDSAAPARRRREKF